VALLAEELQPLPVPQLVVRDARRALGLVAAEFWGRPADWLKVFAVTGTNGKTTISHFFGAVAQAAGQPAAIIGTLGAWIGGEQRRGPGLTTLESADLQPLLAEAVAAGDRWASLEASSHGLEMARLAGTPVDIAVLTQVKRDHFDFHGSFEEYRQAKRRLFTDFGRGAGGHPGQGAVLNADDPTAAWIAEGLSCPVVWYGLDHPAAVWATDIALRGDGSRFLLHWRLPADGSRTAGQTEAGHLPVELALPGRFNVANALAVAAAALLAGFPPAAIPAGLACIRLPGRLERVEVGQPFDVCIDFAHNPAALEALLELKGTVSGRTIVVFGAEGGKDPGKRPLMGQAVARSADYAIITSDNPHGEDPEAIATAVAAGLEDVPYHAPYEVILDRREAIRRAFALAASGDLVLITGKGHETALVGANGAQPFNDAEVARDLLGQAGWVR
jgi:UDP-N-acetylmuramoyl-L-alanyl-D-glutamate--2,6-diaminopimelate ligase